MTKKNQEAIAQNRKMLEARLAREVAATGVSEDVALMAARRALDSAALSERDGVLNAADWPATLSRALTSSLVTAARRESAVKRRADEENPPPKVAPPPAKQLHELPIDQLVHMGNRLRAETGRRDPDAA